MTGEERSVPLTIEDVAVNGHHTLRLRGELDLSSAAELTNAVPRLCGPTTSRVSLDLHEVTFMDSTGLRALLSAAEACERNGCELEVLGASGAVKRLLQITGAIRVLPIDGMKASTGEVVED